MKEIEKSPGSRKVNVVDVLKVNGGVLAAFVLIFVISSVVNPRFCTVGNMMTILRTECLYCTVCLWDDLCHPYREY